MVSVSAFSGQVYPQYQAPGGYPPQQPGAPPQQQYSVQYPGKKFNWVSINMDGCCIMFEVT